MHPNLVECLDITIIFRIAYGHRLAGSQDDQPNIAKTSCLTRFGCALFPNVTSGGCHDSLWLRFKSMKHDRLGWREARWNAPVWPGRTHDQTDQAYLCRKGCCPAKATPDDCWQPVDGSQSRPRLVLLLIFLNRVK